MTYHYFIDMFTGGTPITNPTDRPESVRTLAGSTGQEISNMSTVPVCVSFRPVLGPTTPGGPVMPVPPAPLVELYLTPGQKMTYPSNHPIEAVQVWCADPAFVPVMYAPVEIRAW